MAPAAAPWPVIGRERDVATVLAELTGSGRLGVVVSGEPGVGKTALATVVAAALPGTEVVTLRASGVGTDVPYGVFAPLLTGLPENVVDNPVTMVRVLDAHLAQAGAGGPVVLHVEDVHALDHHSATVLAQLVLSERARLLATGRSPVPAALAALLKEDTLALHPLRPLGLGDVESLLTAVLGAEIALATPMELHRVSQGNPLFLRELVRAALLDDALRRIDGVWTLVGALRAGHHVVDLLREGIAQRGRAEREALEVVALAEPIPLDALLDVVSPAAVATLETDGLLTAGDDGVRLGHALFGETVRRLVPRARSRSLHRRVVSAAAQRGDASVTATLRTVSWALNCGAALPSDQLVAAAALANRLYDPDLALRAARAALGADDTSTTVRAQAELVRAALLRGEDSQARRGLLAARAQVDTDDDRLVLAETAAEVLLRGPDDVAVRHLLDSLTAEVGPPHRGRLEVLTALHDVDAGDFPAAAERLPHLAERSDLDPQARLRVIAALAEVETARGRVDDALAMLDRSGEDLRDAGSALFLRIIRARPAYLSGRITEFEAILAEGTSVLDRHFLFHGGSYQLARAGAHAHRGRYRAAQADLRGAVSALHAFDTDRTLRYALSLSAQIAATVGDAALAERCRAEIEAVPMIDPVILRLDAYRMEACSYEITHGSAEAVRRLDAVAAQAHAATAYAIEMRARHDALVRGDRGQAERIVELGDTVQGPLGRVHALHAVAVTSGAGGDYESAAEAAGAIELFAVQRHCAEAARAAHEAVGDRAGVKRAKAHLARARLAADHERSADDVLGMLTRRERDVARLTAQGLSSREVAERLVLSPRTVESHLHRAYAKLGIGNRRALTALLRPDSDAAAGGA